MSKNSELSVLTKDQAERVDRVTEYRVACVHHAKQAMVYRFLIGVELIELKKQIDHGRWENFRAAHFNSLPSQTASLYVRSAEIVLAAKSPKLGDLELNHLQIENGRLPEDEEKRVLEVLKEVYDGKSQTEFYRSEGLIRDKLAPKYTPPKNVTPEERAEAAREHADALFDSAIGQLRDIIERINDLRVAASAGKPKELLLETRAYGKIFRSKKKK